MQIKISFNLLPSREKTDGTLPIYCRISVGSDSVRFTTGLSVKQVDWDPMRCQVRGKSTEAVTTNELLLKMLTKLREIYSRLIQAGDDISAQDVLDNYRGRKKLVCRNLMEVYAIKVNHISKLIGKDYSKASLIKQKQLAAAVRSFIIYSYDSQDIALTKVNRGFISDLEAYLRTERNMKLISINKVVQSLKSIIMYSLDHKWINDNPFAGHKFRHPKTEVVFLSIEELKKIEEFAFVQSRLNLVKNIFLFSVYTGLHFSDAMMLTREHLIEGKDGNIWIEYVRSKTGRLIRIPLFSKAKILIEHFSTYSQNVEYLIPRFSNQKLNSYLKEIALIVGIKTSLTHKVARKTFGSLLLYYNTPMAVVSELMGHTSILVTQKHYAKLELKKLGDAIQLVDNLI